MRGVGVRGVGHAARGPACHFTEAISFSAYTEFWMKLELTNDKKAGKYALKGITDQWQVAKISIKDFAGLTNVSCATEFVVVFDDQTVSKQKTGDIYLDDIAFER